MRGCGILFPVSSLPSKYGIGCFSKEAYDFIDFLKESGQGYWQILPVGPTGFGDSPYQPFSAFAGNPYFICLETLAEDGLLTPQECERDWGSDQERVDYGALYNGRFAVLRIACDRFREKYLEADDPKTAEVKEAYEKFLKEEAFWLEDYALFMAVKSAQGGRSWLDWDEPLCTRKEDALREAKAELSDEIRFFCIQQFLFNSQWKKLRAYANKNNIKIIGDLPFYVAIDSADAWSHPEAFQMDKDLVPSVVAGCPPDAFSATGQLWGNPVYDWKELKKNGYDWWIRRIERNREFYDVIRIDHFHGFESYFAVPYGDKTAENGERHKGPGIDFFRVLKKKLGDIPMIAEDLGTVTPENVKLLEDTGLPGMKVLQFAFTSWNSSYVNHRHIRNCVVYTGTHDNTTARAWIEEITDGERSYVRRYINSENTDYGRFTWDFIREAYRSVADLCIIPLQDYLVKGKEARINSPGVPDGNWQWRLKPNFLSSDLSRSIYGLSELYGRLPVPEQEAASEEEDA